MPYNAPELTEGYRKNFETLQDAVHNGDLALLSAVRKSDRQPVALVCAVNYVDGEYEMVPLAVMCEGNPYEDFEPPMEETADDESDD